MPELSALHILALHGFSGHGADFERLIRRAPAPWNWTCPDLPGHGAGPRVRQDPAGQCQDFLRAVLDKLPPQCGIALGYSLGGRLLLQALCAGATPPAALILIGTHPGLEDPHERAVRRRQDDAWAELLMEQGMETFLQKWKNQPLLRNQASLQPPIHLPWADSANADPKQVALILRNLSPGALPPLWHAVPRITCPTLLVAGAEDTKYAALNERLQKSWPTARTAVIPRSGHAPHLENPDGFLEIASAFLDPDRKAL